MNNSELMNAIYKNAQEPSHICSVCGKEENPNSPWATTVFWLCDECLAKLKKLLKES